MPQAGRPADPFVGDNHHVVIVGGGFGGLYAARALRGAPLRITLIDRRNFHLFQPLLYQVATGGLSPANIAAPLRGILARQRNARVLLGEVRDVDVDQRRVVLADGSVAYDTLVVATGAVHSYFGHDEWAAAAPGLKTIEDATDIRRRILLAFENAERQADPDRARAWLTFVVIGGGPTGVELAGALAEIARRTLRDNFRHIDPASATILLVEGADRILPLFPPPLSRRAEQSLRRLGVTVRTRTLVTDIRSDGVVLRTGDHEEHVAARTVLWAAGVQASPLGRTLAARTGAALDRAGRVAVQPDLTLPGHPEIFVIGDLALCRDERGEALPGIAPVAMQQARYVARVIRCRLRRGGRTVPAAAFAPFRYRDRGIMATIGRAAAVARVGRLHFWGYPAWLVWLFIHLLFLIEFQNRVLVMIQWAWNYFTRNRSARLITGEDLR